MKLSYQFCVFLHDFFGFIAIFFYQRLEVGLLYQGFAEKYFKTRNKMWAGWVGGQRASDRATML